jgi:hypothetical protein
VLAAQSEQAGLVSRYEMIRPAGFGHCRQEIVGGIGGARHGRQAGDRFGEGADPIDEPSRLYRPDQRTDLPAG